MSNIDNMHIHFGLHLDSLDPAIPTTGIADATVGPQGLLAMLESDLGLPPVLQSATEQVVAYQTCLAEVDNPGRFYHRSFTVDPVGVARELHRWRCQWYEAGWTGTFPDTAPQRLKDMAAIEALAADRVPLCLGQRLGRVLNDLESRRTQITSLTLLTDPEALSQQWRRLVEKMGYTVASGLELQVQAKPDTDLHAVQTRLLTLSDGQGPTEKIPLNQDGSFLVLRATSRDISARAVAETLRANPSPKTVVIAEQDGIIIDNALERSGLPRCGFQHYSRFRAVSQVLKLSLALLWEPINPHLLLQFFIHPLGPLTARTRRELADAVSSEPGIGGRSWQQAIHNLEKALNQEEDAEARITRLRADIAEWFESPRYSPAEGAPTEVLMARIQRVQNWLQARMANIEDPAERVLFGGAVAQADTLSAAIKAHSDQGHTHMPQLQLERLVDEVSQAQPNPDVFAEVGHVRACNHVDSITQPWQQVIWWDLAPQRNHAPYPWSAEELNALDDAGVLLPPMETTLQQRSKTWLQPIAHAQARCILVVHDSDEGHHPLWTQINNLFENWAEVRLEEHLFESASPELPFLTVPIEPVSTQLLPAARRWWELPETVSIPNRPVESYSSLSKLFYHSHEWVLNYHARLRTGRAEDLADGPLLYGTLAHRLFEEFFTRNQDWRELDTNHIQNWLNEAIPNLIQREGAVLLEPGRGVDHEQISTTLERALHRLIEHLHQANVVSVVPEHEEEAPYPASGGTVGGKIDLLLTRDNGQEIVIDAKWGSEKYRGEELEKNLHLQLASYAYLRKQANAKKEWPYQTYFIVTSANMLAPDDTVFPGARVFSPPAGPDVAALWAKGEQSFAWRRELLNHGLIEVNCAGAEATDRSIPPEGALPNEENPSNWDDYINLTGWDEFA